MSGGPRRLPSDAVASHDLLLLLGRVNRALVQPRAPEARAVDCQLAPAWKESVGSWPLAITILDAIGGMPVYPYPSSRRDGERVTPS